MGLTRRTFSAALGAGAATYPQIGLSAAHAESGEHRGRILARVGSPPPAVTSRLASMGIHNAVEHKLSTDEERLVAEAVAVLAPLHVRILSERLRSISFLDGLPNNALTSEAADLPGSYDISIRSGVLRESATQILTQKDSSCFEHASESNVYIDAGRTPGLVYGLLHEATHVVDMALTRASSADGHAERDTRLGGFAKGVWLSPTQPVPQFDLPELRQLTFGVAAPVPASQTAATYAALQRTPFASLYGSRNRSEDLAEFVALSHIVYRLGVDLRTRIRIDGDMISDIRRMHAPRLRRRLRAIAPFYGQA